MKISHIINLYNDQAERQLRPTSVYFYLKRLLKSGIIEQPRAGYYRLIQG